MQQRWTKCSKRGYLSLLVETGLKSPGCIFELEWAMKSFDVFRSRLVRMRVGHLPRDENN